MNIEKISLDHFNPNKKEDEKPFVSHIQKPKKKKPETIKPISFFSQHKI